MQMRLLGMVLAASLIAIAGACGARAQMLGPHSAVPPAGPQGGPVTAWTVAADMLGGGGVNWRTLAVMHIAMHDALNAVEPRYRRIMPPLPDEPAGADPTVAMAAAAYQVLLARHPEHAANVADFLFRDTLSRTPPGPAQDAGIQLGGAIALAAFARYTPSTTPPKPFPASEEDGKWRPTPPFRQAALVGEAKPFLFDTLDVAYGPPPPALGSPEYIAAVEEVRRLGDDRPRGRNQDQTTAAEFWGRQTSQRNYLYLGMSLIADHPLEGGMWDEARAMAMLTMALADSYILAWEAKRHWSYWRPITAINQGGHGVQADPRWYPLLPTPPHPDYPSGHASDCAAGAHVLDALFGHRLTSVSYTAHDLRGTPSRTFPSLPASAEECAESRLWAGAHFRPANEEGLRIGRAIARRALEVVTPLTR
jgi:hypothetical protein